MKSLLLVLTVLFSSISFAQDSTQVDKVEAPIIVSNLHFGQTYKINDIELKFVEVLQDSRCPKNVTCVWAGEVVVLVDVFKNGKKTEQKTLTLSPKSYLQNQLGNLISLETLQVSGFNVLPYPVSGSKIKNEDYYIQLDVRNN